MGKRNLIYTICTFKADVYIPMIRVWLKSLLAYSDPRDFDLLFITNDLNEKEILAIKDLYKFSHTLMKVPNDYDLASALFRKFDIIDYSPMAKYDKVLFLDCDIIIQKNIATIFDLQPILEKGILYASKEENSSHENIFWSLGNYKPAQLDFFRRENIKCFNSGTFMFKPCAKMTGYFKKLRKFARKYENKHFYDQSFLNYFFNARKAANTTLMEGRVKIFAEVEKCYKNEVILHYAGIERYKEKEIMMNASFDRLQRGECDTINQS